MRVIGGKKSSDGFMYAVIVCTAPGGPADKAGLQKGDKVRDLCYNSFIIRGFQNE